MSTQARSLPRGYAKICDLGFARFVLSKTYTFLGTPATWPTWPTWPNFGAAHPRKKTANVFVMMEPYEDSMGILHLGFFTGLCSFFLISWLWTSLGFSKKLSINTMALLWTSRHARAASSYELTLFTTKEYMAPEILDFPHEHDEKAHIVVLEHVEKHGWIFCWMRWSPWMEMIWNNWNGHILLRKLFRS